MAADTGALELAPSLTDLLAEVASASSEAVALRCGAERMTYGELVDLSGRIASTIIRSGAGRFVGLHMQRDLRTPLAIAGILRAGCAYVPLDPTHPDGRLEQLCGTPAWAAS